jgi:hypothetical protein
MDAGVSAYELEIEQAGAVRRVPLVRGLTRIGGPGCEVVLDGAGADQLHLWDDPLKLVFIGKGELPRVDGAAVEERALDGGERLEWRGVRLALRRLESPVIQEIPLPAAPPARPDERAWTRVRAGLLFELGLADRAAARRWQEAVLRGEFDPDAAARELEHGAAAAPGDARLVERSGRLLRDLLMAPYQRGLRGAGRRVRGAARSGAAFLVAQVVVIGVLVVLLAVVLLVLRLRWGWSVDAFLDRIVELVPS